MYAFALRRVPANPKSWRVRWIVWRMRRTQRLSGSRNAARYFVRRIRVYPLETMNESYYQDVVNYDHGMLMAHMGRQEEADALISKIGILPGAGDNLLFGFHQHEALALHEKQRAAAERGMVSIFATSLPKSGSASLTQSIADFMGAPVMRLSVGRTPTYALIQTWADRVKQGGMVTHDHFTATPHNLEVIKKAGIERIVVQVRDPRSSSLSNMNMAVKLRGPSTSRFYYRVLFRETFRDLFRETFRDHVAWLRYWIEAEEKNPWLKIQWVHYHDFAADPRKVMASLLAPYDHVRQMREIRERIEAGEGDMVQANFHAGDDNKWRSVYPKRLQKKMWETMPDCIINHLNLTP